MTEADLCTAATSSTSKTAFGKTKGIDGRAKERLPRGGHSENRSFVLIMAVTKAAAFFSFLRQLDRSYYWRHIRRSSMKSLLISALNRHPPQLGGSLRHLAVALWWMLHGAHRRHSETPHGDWRYSFAAGSPLPKWAGLGLSAMSELCSFFANSGPNVHVAALRFRGQ